MSKVTNDCMISNQSVKASASTPGLSEKPNPIDCLPFMPGHDYESVLSELRYNVIPELEDWSAIRLSITQAEERLFALSTKREDLILAAESRSNEEVESECMEIRKFIAIASSRLAPIRRLLPELLSLVFTHSFDDSTFFIGRPRSYEHYAVAAVSSHWRQVALSTPSFWTKFSVSLRGGDGALQILQMCLQRSKGFPLTINLRTDIVSRGPFRAGIIQQLIEHSERWFKVSLPLDPELLELLSPIRGRLPSLQIMSVIIPSKNHSAAVGNTMLNADAFESAPKLHSLSLYSVTGAMGLPRLPLAQVERLMFTIARTNDANFKDIVARSPNIRKLTCHCSTHLGYSPPTRTVPVLLSELRAIELKFSDIALFFFSAPRLESLSMAVFHNISGDIFFPFIERSGCNLRSLSLTKLWMHESVLQQVLRATPALEELSIWDARRDLVTDSAMQALVMHPTRPALIPSLQILNLHGSYDFQTTTLLDMFESRTTPQQPTQTARLRVVDLRLDQRQFREDELVRFRCVQGVVLSLRRFDDKKVSIALI
ncbi:hypothetical protein B0H15DRAFT_888246 [Mycena belliarum]|uniref:F-box domain-containing protein n=1 Tax=Mycena belliarum TaxID=1033014 RepID=A0AAD6XKE6_9AGAR|nr:hypothetical protein B0H15DRAFT_888246 [Mycena belliae]